MTVYWFAHSAEEMHKVVDAFSDASKKLGLKINMKKTEVLYQPNSTRTRLEDIMKSPTWDALHQILGALMMIKEEDGQD